MSTCVMREKPASGRGGRGEAAPPFASPDISDSAISRSPSIPNRTKPNPLDLPVLGSVTAFAARA